jgi:hypothetical protein
MSGPERHYDRGGPHGHPDRSLEPIANHEEWLAQFEPEVADYLRQFDEPPSADVAEVEELATKGAVEASVEADARAAARGLPLADFDRPDAELDAVLRLRIPVTTPTERSTT